MVHTVRELILAQPNLSRNEKIEDNHLLAYSWISALDSALIPLKYKSC